MSLTEAGAYGERMGAVLRIPSPPTLSMHHFAATRVACGEPDHGMTAPIPKEDAYLVSLQLRDVGNYELWVAGRSVEVELSRRGTITMLDLSQDPRANLRDPFDSLHLYVPRFALNTLADEHGVRRVDALDVRPGISIEDAVIRHLGSALLPVLEAPGRASLLFVDHIAIALHAHIATTYGHVRATPPEPPGFSVANSRFNGAAA